MKRLEEPGVGSGIRGWPDRIVDSRTVYAEARLSSRGAGLWLRVGHSAGRGGREKLNQSLVNKYLSLCWQLN